MNLRDLKYLASVAEHGHFGKAAKASFVSQPTLSMQIKKLEEELGVQLFERNNKQVMVTAAGKEVLAHVQTILQEVDAIREQAKHFQDPLGGRLVLGAFPTLASYYLPKVLTLVEKHLPKIELYLIEEKTDDLLARLRDGTIDLALLALPINNEDMATAPLFEDPFLLAVPSNHLLAKRKTVDFRDLSENQLLLLEEGHCLRDHALSVCTMAGLKEMKGFRATSMETLRQMVASGVGITLMPLIAATKHPNITYLRFAAPEPSRTIGLVWRKTYARKALVKKMTAILS
ncbi:MAG: LysR family transcriptional regulator [Proteobacteria bacterium]|nr:LysR family transcriptional regulator [Pseudomonadota bacterium]